jgi:hypothetical protein
VIIRRSLRKYNNKDNALKKYNSLIKDNKNTHKNNSKNDKNSIEKNQQEFGHRKRIKP